MTYYSIFFNNIKRSFKNYYIYLMSTVFSVIVYYLFASVKYNPQVLSVVSRSGSVQGLFGFTGGIVLIFATVFIGYSNSFFVRKRKKEIALYSLMGMKKIRVAIMLFVENIIIAIISLVLGIAIGTVFSKLFIMGLLRMMNQVIYVEFTFSAEAAKDTSMLFMIIFVVASINSYRVIKKIQLVELFSAPRKNEKVPVSNPIFAIGSIALLAFGYWLSQNMVNKMLVANMGLVLATVIVGTYGVFAYFLSFFIKIMKKRKKTYYSGNNLLAISNIGYRIKNHSYTLATIAILSATTIVSLGMADSLYYDFNAKAEANYPFTYVYGNKGEELNNNVLELIDNSQKVDLVGAMIISRLDGNARYIGDNQPEHDFVRYDLENNNKYHILSNSQYNESMKLRSLQDKQVNLAEDESLLVYSTFGIDTYEYVKGSDYEVNLQDQHKKKVTIIDTQAMSLIYTGYSSKYLVVSDNIYDEYVKLGAPVSSYTCIKTTDQLATKQLTEDMKKLIPEEANLKAYYDEYRSSNHTYAILAFTAFFVAIVFLLSTGSIIYFKLITEANEEKERYTILKKIGISKRDIIQSIKKQMLLVFIVPLAVGLIHSAFALKAFGTLLAAHIFMPVILTMIGYSIIYFVYYLLTVNYYKKIILN